MATRNPANSASTCSTRIGPGWRFTSRCFITPIVPPADARIQAKSLQTLRSGRRRIAPLTEILPKALGHVEEGLDDFGIELAS